MVWNVNHRTVLTIDGYVIQPHYTIATGEIFFFCEVGIEPLNITYIDFITALPVFYRHRVSTQLQLTNIYLY